MAIVGFGFTIIFCTTFCRACNRMREEQVEREAWRRSERDGRPPPVFVIPFPRNASRDSDDTGPRLGRESTLQYTNPAFSEPPPAYSELGFKLEDLPPAYTQYSVPVYPIALEPPAAAGALAHGPQHGPPHSPPPGPPES
uniref:Uncharacterized protein n=1 Tax=Knipowitschia caucasica TaxID=637954 RepID=A0AAV2MMV1_KNICA